MPARVLASAPPEWHSHVHPAMPTMAGGATMTG